LAGNKSVAVVLQPGGEVLIPSAHWCESAACRLIGLQFRRRLRPEEALLLVHPRAGTLSTSIHMFFVFFPIAAVWIDSGGLVTSAQLARPWRPYYASAAAARYVLEADPGLLERVRPGDMLEFRRPSDGN
jgi:uncharacterized membrane protein (UPF0127 family)